MKQKSYRGTKENPTHDELKQLLRYDSETGVFHWREYRRGMSSSGIAGTKTKEGYCQIAINDKLHFAHRLAWFYVHGVWPRALIDHIDENKLNNAISNLREATHAENVRHYLAVAT